MFFQESECWHKWSSYYDSSPESWQGTTGQ